MAIEPCSIRRRQPSGASSSPRPSPAERDRWRSSAAARKRGLGRAASRRRSASSCRGFSGVTLYEPEELVLTAGAGTPLAEIEAVLGRSGQMLAFEPPDLAPLLRQPRGRRRRSGGVARLQLSGPRRIKAGAARDHFLGFAAVSGRGEIFKAGGRVVKNVTGYDLSQADGRLLRHARRR